jgi:hypothetical protein
MRERERQSGRGIFPHSANTFVRSSNRQLFNQRRKRKGIAQMKGQMDCRVASLDERFMRARACRAIACTAPSKAGCQARCGGQFARSRAFGGAGDFAGGGF